MIYGSVHWETYGYHHDKGALISTASQQLVNLF